MNMPNEIGRTYDGGMLDITGAKDIEIQINCAGNGKVIWINIDGICCVRVCRVKRNIIIEDQINETTSTI